MLCPVGLPGALSVDILALLLYWPTYAPITVRLAEPGHPRDSFNSDAYMQQWTSSSLGLDNGISPDRRQAII